MSRIKLSMGAKLVLIILTILLVFGVSTMGIVYSKIKASNIASMKTGLHAYTLMLGENVELSKVNSIIDNPTKDNPDVQAMNKEFDRMIGEMDGTIANIYLVTLKDGKTYFPVMSSSLMVGDFTYGSEYVGDASFDTPAEDTFKTKEIQASDIIKDKFGTWISGFFPIQDDIGDVVALYAIDIDVSKTNAKAMNETLSLLLMIVAFLIVSAVIVYFFVTRMIKPVVKLTSISQQLAAGDFTFDRLEIVSKDEVGALSQNFNEMVDNMSRLISQIMLNSEQVAAAAEEISASTEEMAQGSTQQAESSQVMFELFTTFLDAIQLSSQRAKEAAELSRQAEGIAQNGGKVMHNSIESMNEVSEQMALLVSDSKQIGEIVAVIEDIAEQTNLLALNAAIEAARAGEQGRGFGVVAEEVRKLAERSGEATKQIGGIIRGIQANTEKTVRAVEEGVSQSQRTRKAFEDIELKVGETSLRVYEIAEASVSQQSGASEFKLMIESIAASSEEGAASAIETASATQSLAQTAEKMNESISAFKVNR
ncbi:methyl-accepting chemotaxis protein [Paenibacillus albus]|uniref:Methyl-accepting chemotaxis protein n=1 Tax=Paenibacillus albus TaxID=2495582 RepID=A0A3S9AAG8_9BACL|nr:methyl-accepting chemotaxis protein [Paenibacillus albus]AZN42777.1 methyl-accepting chemotaxis protein [Paenibacillus albus]